MIHFRDRKQASCALGASLGKLGVEGSRGQRHPHPGQRQFGPRHRGVADAAHRETEPQAGGLVAGLPVSSSKLEYGGTGSSEGGVPLRGVVPPSGV